MARPKTEFARDVKQLQKQANMIKRGTEMLDERWDEVVNAMLDTAIKKKSVMAATWLRDTFIGKPTEKIQHTSDSDSGDDKFSGFMVVPLGKNEKNSSP